MITLWVVGVSFLLSVLITPLVIKLSQAFKIIDYPTRPHPAILHKKPLPRGGGLAIFAAILLTYLFFVFLEPTLITKHIIGVFLGALIVVVVGLLDDKYDINPYVRLLSNFLAALAVVAFGVGINWITNPFGGQIRFDEIILHFTLPQGYPFGGPHSIVLFADLFAFLWIAWLMNALNWSSGVDGQISGIAAIASVTLGFVSISYLSSDPSQVPLAILAFATAGSYLGFLPWSFFPQKIMPGYSGASLAGFMIAVLSILAGGKLAIAAIVLAVPLVDGAWTVGRRVLSGKIPVWGDKEHLHHHLIALGWSIPKIAIFYYFLTALFAIFAISLDSRGKFFAIVMIFAILLAALLTIAAVARKFGVKSND
ncbi:MAG: MraY family glycosyltransferase [Candidatus Woykebacteria bacterium]